MGWRGRILVVDDCPDTVEIISALMEMLGHECRGVQTGVDALEEARRFEPDIVLLDLMLPDISGFTVGLRLRDVARRPLYLAALTGRGTTRDRERTQAAGFDQHLLKPVEAVQLRDVVSRAALAQAS